MKQMTVEEMDAVRELFQLLTKHTDEKGNYSLMIDEHKTGYQSVREYVNERKEYHVLDDEDLQDVDLNSDTLIYLSWFKNTPVGNYTIYANSFVTILKRVRAIIADVENPLANKKDERKVIVADHTVYTYEIPKLTALASNDPKGNLTYRSPDGEGIDGFLKPDVEVNLIALSHDNSVKGCVANNDPDWINDGVHLDKIIVRTELCKDTVLTLTDLVPNMNFVFHRPASALSSSYRCISASIQFERENIFFGLHIEGAIDLRTGKLRVSFKNTNPIASIDVVGYSVDARYNEANG